MPDLAAKPKTARLDDWMVVAMPDDTEIVIGHVEELGVWHASKELVSLDATLAVSASGTRYILGERAVRPGRVALDLAAAAAMRRAQRMSGAAPGMA